MAAVNVKKIERGCVGGFKPYMPGRPISEVKKRFKLKKIIKMASNENPLGPSKKIYPALKKAVKDVFLYPVGNSQSLRESIASKFGLKTTEILAGSGTDEVIELLGKTFCNPEDEIIASKHAFIRYKMTGELMNCSVKEVPMKNYTHDLEGMLRIVSSETKIIFIANPNNPTGTYVSDSAIRAFLSKIPENILVCLDEAYFEYASVHKGYPDGVKLYKEGFSNIVALRTFSKIYALAGLRVGYAIGDPAVIGALDRVRPPFNVNSLAQVAAEVSLGDASQLRKGREMVARQKKRFYEFLDKYGIEYLPSAANFVLLRSRSLGLSGVKLFNRLLEKGIIVREMSEYELPEWVRVTIGLPGEMDYLFKVMKKIKEAKG